MPESSSNFLKLFEPGGHLRADELNGNFIGISDSLINITEQLERLENALVKVYKKQELNDSDLSFQSSIEMLFGKPEKPGRYGILKNKEK